MLLIGASLELDFGGQLILQFVKKTTTMSVHCPRLKSLRQSTRIQI